MGISPDGDELIVADPSTGDARPDRHRGARRHADDRRRAAPREPDQGGGGDHRRRHPVLSAGLDPARARPGDARRRRRGVVADAPSPASASRRRATSCASASGGGITLIDRPPAARPGCSERPGRGQCGAARPAPRDGHRVPARVRVLRPAGPRLAARHRWHGGGTAWTSRIRGSIRAAAAGDDAAFTALMRDAQPHVWRFVRHLLGDDDLAADVTQETFVRVAPHRSAGSASTPGSRPGCSRSPATRPSTSSAGGAPAQRHRAAVAPTRGGADALARHRAQGGARRRCRRGCGRRSCSSRSSVCATRTPPRCSTSRTGTVKSRVFRARARAGRLVRRGHARSRRAARG